MFKVHRRTLYTFIKRTSPPPQLSTFDAPSREACSVRRERTNTPLQALLMLNDPQYVEAAVGLAERAFKDVGADVQVRLGYMFRLCACREPDEAELQMLLQVYQDHLCVYQQDVDAARQLLAIGTQKPDENTNVPQLAASVMVGNLLLNLDEVIMKN